MINRFILLLNIICLTLSAPLFAQGTVTPGSGWSAATEQPATLGSSTDRGYDCKAIARWDVVPRQTFSDTFNVGIVAFHINGINRVEIAADGGTWTTVTDMTLNERTGVWEYWATLHASDFSDGEVDLRARIYPETAGVPRVLQEDAGHELLLYANGTGTLAAEEVYVSPARGNDSSGDGSESKPYATYLQGMEHLLDSPGGVGGGTVYLDSGVYQYPNPTGDGCNGRWLTITPRPGVSREHVVWSGAGSGVLQKWLHIKNITINHSMEDAAPFKLRSGPYGNHFWVDGCETYGTGYAGDSLSSGSFVNGGTIWQTDVTTHDHKGTIGGSIVRNINAWYLSGDFVNSRGLNINCHVRHMRPAPGVHPDIVQHFSGKTENYIMYGLKAVDVKSQGINIGQLDTIRGLALVNVQIEFYPSSLRNFIPSAPGEANHILMWHNMYTGASTMISESRGGQTNMDIRGCIFSSYNPQDGLDYSGWTMDNNHFYNQDDISGTDATYGDPQFTTTPAWDGAGNQTTEGDYRPSAGSPLLGRIAGPLVPVDVENNPRSALSAVGAYAGPDEVSGVKDVFGLNQPPLPVFSVSPNPVTAGGTLHLNAPQGKSLFLYDADGIVVRKLDAVTDLTGIDAGLYFAGDGAQAVKILVR